MAPHIKLGHGFAIIYGGRAKIKWIKGTEWDALMRAILPTVPGLGPVSAAAEVAECAGQFLQWWEQRRQFMLQQAAFEERRLEWLADVYAQWYAELSEGNVRQDTIWFLDREVSRFLGKAGGNNHIDVPSSLLLHLERSANMLVRLNLAIQELIMEQRPNFTLPGVVEHEFQYRPYNSIGKDQGLLAQYVKTLEYVAESSLPGSGRADSAFAGWDMILATVWRPYTAVKLLEIASKAGRFLEFTPLVNLSLELRSAMAQLKIVSALPQLMKVYSLEDVLQGRPGQVLPNNGQLLLLDSPSTEGQQASAA